MSDRTLMFYEDGPVAFTCEQYHDFARFVGDKSLSFDDMVFSWPNQNYPDHIRRLCLRNILRQTCQKTTTVTQYTQDEHNFGRLLFLLNSPSHGYHLPTLLKLQPALLHELTGELLYNLEHNIRLDMPYSFMYDDLDQLILMLLPIVDEQIGHNLWHHHSLRSYPISRFEELLNFCEESDEKVPAWLKVEIENKTKELVSQEIQDNLDYFKEEGHIDICWIPDVNSSTSDKLSVSYIVADHITSIAYSITSPKSSATANFRFSTRLIRFLEKKVPQPLTYINREQFIALITLLITSPKLARKFTRRHLAEKTTLSPQELRNRSGQIFLHYIYGIVAAETPKDHVFLNRLNDLIYSSFPPKHK